MWKRIFASSLFACSLPLHAQQPSLPEPQYSQQYNAVKDGQLVVLERQTAVSDTQSKRFFVISPSTRVFESISNTASPVRVGPNTHFIICAHGHREPRSADTGPFAEADSRQEGPRGAYRDIQSKSDSRRRSEP